MGCIGEFKMSFKTFIKDVGIIAFTQILTSLGGFLLLPIITKTLGSYDYGTWSQISITVYLLSPLALMGLSMGAVRYLSSETDKEKIREGFFSITIFVMFTGFIVSMLVFLLSDLLAATIFKDPNTTDLIKAGSFLILLSAIDQIAIFYFRIFRYIKIFSYLILFQVFGKLVLIFIFLNMGLGLLGVISAVLVIEILLFIIAMSIVISQIGFAIPRFSYISDYLKYSAPLTPISLIKWITDSSDRYMVGYFLGLSSVGVYSASYAIGNLVNLFVMPIQMILFPELSKLFDNGDIDKVKTYLSYSMRYFLFIAIPAVFGLYVLSKPILNILTTSEFASGSIVIPIIALSGLLAGVFQIVINITLIVKKTTFNMYIQIVAALLNIVFNFVLIPSIGILGAAIATLISYILMVIACIHISFKHITFDLNFIFISKCVVASSIMSIVVLSLDTDNIIELLIVSGLGAVIYPLILLSIKGFSKNELNMVKELYRGVKKKYNY